MALWLTPMHEKRLSGPNRIVLNFAHGCNMSCEWCYVPFAGDRPEAAVCKRIIERSAEIGFKVFTFAGGDPMLYAFLPELITAARNCGFFVHVDTNGIGLRHAEEAVSLLSDGIDLLGLPLDGPRAEIHDRMRSSESHFTLVIELLRWLAPHTEKVKINTVVSKYNASAIAEMVPLLASLHPSRWSLYQYWPLSHGRRATTHHLISDSHFSAVTGSLPATVDGVTVEVNPLPVRRLTYPFVSHEGTIYVHNESDESSYSILGSIFDDAVVKDLFSKCGTERDEAKSRYAISGVRQTD